MQHKHVLLLLTQLALLAFDSDYFPLNKLDIRS